MAHYDANEIVENIERVLEEREAADGGLSEAAQRSLFRDRRETEQKRSIVRRLERGPLPRMRQFQAIDKVPEGARLGFFKKVFARLLRLVTAPQAAYNFENLEALQALARETDQLRERLKRVEDGPARPMGMVYMEGSEETRLNGLVTQHLHFVQNNLNQVTQNVEQISGALTQLVDNISVVSGRINTYGVRQKDVYTEVASARLDISRIWTELGLVYESVDKRAEDLWQGLDERDVQLLVNTEAVQHLHAQVSSIETNSKELRARLLALSEQLSIQQEILENMSEDLRMAPSSPRRRSEKDPASRELPASTPMKREDIATPEIAEKAAAASGMIQRQLDLAYLRFQRQFRGDEEELRTRQRDYIEILSKHVHRTPEDKRKPMLLDAACGDGIFIELLTQAGWDARGVDLNDVMVRQGHSRNLPIEQGDAIEYIERCPPKSQEIITSFQFVEHLPPAVLMRFLKACYRALRPQGLLLIETINPHTLKAMHWYHLDLTHQRLVFPEMLQLLAETAGFLTIEWKGVNPVAESDRLRIAGGEAEKANFRMLNELLFGEQDYYFIGRKPGGVTPEETKENE